MSSHAAARSGAIARCSHVGAPLMANELVPSRYVDVLSYAIPSCPRRRTIALPRRSDSLWHLSVYIYFFYLYFFYILFFLAPLVDVMYADVRARPRRRVSHTHKNGQRTPKGPAVGIPASTLLLYHTATINSFSEGSRERGK